MFLIKHNQVAKCFHPCNGTLLEYSYTLPNQVNNTLPNHVKHTLQNRVNNSLPNHVHNTLPNNENNALPIHVNNTPLM